MNKLPKVWRGAEVVRGKAMDVDDMDSLLERMAMDEFDASAPMYIVMDDNALNEVEQSSYVRAFRKKSDALKYARGCGHGNVDQRVLTVTAQTLVVATDNDL